MTWAGVSSTDGKHGRAWRPADYPQSSTAPWHRRRQVGCIYSKTVNQWYQHTKGSNYSSSLCPHLQSWAFGSPSTRKARKNLSLGKSQQDGHGIGAHDLYEGNMRVLLLGVRRLKGEFIEKMEPDPLLRLPGRRPRNKFIN